VFHCAPTPHNSLHTGSFHHHPPQPTTTNPHIVARLKSTLPSLGMLAHDERRRGVESAPSLPPSLGEGAVVLGTEPPSGLPPSPEPVKLSLPAHGEQERRVRFPTAAGVPLGHPWGQWGTPNPTRGALTARTPPTINGAQARRWRRAAPAVRAR